MSDCAGSDVSDCAGTDVSDCAGLGLTCRTVLGWD